MSYLARIDLSRSWAQVLNIFVELSQEHRNLVRESAFLDCFPP